MKTPTGSFNGAAASADVPTRGTAAELDHLINVTLDNASLADTVNTVVQTAQSLSDHALQQVEPKTLSRMMLELGRYAAECEGFGYEPENDVIEAGYKLVRAARLPDNFMRKLRGFEEKMHGRMKDYHLMDRLDFGARLSPGMIQNFSERFLKDFAECYGMHDVPKLKLYEDKKSGDSGSCIYDEASKCSVVRVNIANITSMKDLPELILVLGHEGLHAYSDSVKRGRADLSLFDQDSHSQFTMLNIFNRSFYSSERKDVYYNHGEEHLAEMTGVGFAVRAMTRMGLTPKAEHFRVSLSFLTQDVVDKLVERDSQKNAVGAPRRASLFLPDRRL